MEKCDPKSDLLFFINVFLERGNNIAKASTRCEDGMGEILKRKVMSYGITIDPSKNRGALGTKELTLSRIAQAFAPCTAAVIIGHNLKGKLVSKLLGGLQIIMQYTIFSRLISTGATYPEELREIAQILNMEMSIMLATPKEKRKLFMKPVSDLLEESSQYVDAAMNPQSLTKRRLGSLLKQGLWPLLGTPLD
ncbi:unnamed protein product [Arctia plantaginis]|uniref:Uncharacterized protein n=1 Tax=Arctia plantaginis TaxID=874455 RepID=A0A8S1BNM4_ARCPL|nr:unnamed protein product [Arctia plantaginis]